MNELDKKITTHFEGKVVRKDLTKLVKGNAVVPTYVLEYLLGQHCASNDEEIINHGIETVKNILRKNYVHRDEARIIQGNIRDYGAMNLIDKISVRLNDKKNQYEADFANLALNRIPISDAIVKEHKKLLSTGVWSIVKLDFRATDERDATPWIIEALKPIQISYVEMDEYKKAREKFNTDEWIDLLLQTMGLNPAEFSDRSKLIQLLRLVPFVENNYNLIELGPKGTGKSHIYSEMSPHGILISGGEVTKAKLFVNNTTGDVGLVGYWDVVAYDEFAGKSKKSDQGMIDIMKNYMANKSFSRGTQVYGASASMVFVGNTDNSVPYMLSHSNLFEALPKDYYDTAFLDRIHAYIPGWEVDKLRNEMFSNGYGFVVDYLAEILKELRKEDRTNEYAEHFELSDNITIRDKTAIAKTYAGLLKIIFPAGEPTLDERKNIMEFAIELRRRVKLQLLKMDDTFEEVGFVYRVKGSSKFKEVLTLEEIQYLGREAIFGNITEDAAAKGVEESSQESKNEVKPKAQLVSKHFEIYDNMTGISYEKMFGEYLKGARQIQIIDPYIRYYHQMKNLVELFSLIASYKDEDDKVNILLQTSNLPEYEAEAIEKFREMQDSLETRGIIFDFEMKDHDKIHDRYILIDDNWKIVMGRGLDIWQKSGGSFDIADTNQLFRKSKAFHVTILGKGEF